MLRGTNTPTREQTTTNNNSLLKEYLEVFVQNNKQDLIGASLHALNAVKLIEKSNKVSGSVSLKRKYKSLNVRWTTKPKNTIVMIDNEPLVVSSNYLQRDTIVKLSLSKNSVKEGYSKSSIEA